MKAKTYIKTYCVLIVILFFTILRGTNAMASVADDAIKWAKNIADDQSHGYSQVNRWGNPDYDCSSFVISAYRAAGLKLKDAVNTANMKKTFMAENFEWHSANELNLNNESEWYKKLQKGDILLNVKDSSSDAAGHTEMYYGNQKLIGAHNAGPSRGSSKGGDQGTEISVDGYNRHPWDGVLRYVGAALLSVKDAKRTVPNGMYRIKMRGTAYSLAVKGSSTSNGAKIQLYTDSETSASEWFYFNYEGSGYYSIKGRASGLALTADGTSQGSSLSIESYSGSSSQLWIVYIAEGINNFYLIPKSAVNSDGTVKGVVDVKDGKAQDNQVIQIWTPNRTEAQMFHLTPGKTLANGIYYIKSKLASSAYSLSVKGNSTSVGSNVHLWAHNDINKFEKWKITHVMSGRYIITNEGSGLALEVKGGNAASGTNVQQATPDSTKEEQLWQIALDNDGNYSFRPYISPGCVLTVEGNVAEDGANINISSSENRVGQRFSVVKYVAPTSITLDKDNSNIWEGQSLTLKAALKPSNATEPGIKWTSSNTNVATVDQTGKVTGVKAGTTIVTAASNDAESVKATCSITVAATVKPVMPTGRTIDDGIYQIRKQGTGYSISVKNNSKEAGALLSISADGNDNESTLFNVKYIESGYYTLTNVASGFLVDVLNAKSDAGTAIQQWKSNGSNAQKWYIVENTNGSYYLIPKHATNRALDLVGNKDDEGNGLQLFYIHTGTGQKYEFVPVGKSVTGVSLDRTQLTLNEGDKFKLNETIEPAGAANTAVIWSSTDPDKADVASDGTVTAVAEGSSRIIVTTNDGSKTAECSVTVVKAVKPVTGLVLDPEKMSMSVGERSELVAGVIPADATNRQINWLSSDNSVARVDENGFVTAVSAGEAVITAEAADKSIDVYKKDCIITVSRQAEGIALSEHEVILKKGEKGTLQATIMPAGSIETGVLWSVSGDAVSIDQEGNYIAQKGGTAVITAAIEGTELSDKCTISVIQLTEEVLIDEKEIMLEEGEEGQVSAKVLPEDVSNGSIIWRSMDESVATVDDTGKIKGIRKGVTVIVAEAEDTGIEAECSVLVIRPVTGLILDRNVLNLEIETAEKLTATPQPEGAANQEIRWESDNEDVAVVDNEGYVYAISGGAATVTAATPDGKYKATCTVNVKVPVFSVDLNKKEIELEVGESYALKADVEPWSASNQNITWGSTESAVATVNEEGKVTAVSPGTAQITVTTEEGGKTASCMVTVRKRIISGCRIEIDNAALVYNGQPKFPNINVTDDNLQLTRNVDYEVSYEENINAGTGNAVITGIGNYEGVARKGFAIKKAANSIVALDIVCESSAENETTQKITAKSTGGVISYSSENAYLHISEDGTITIPANYEGETTVTITAEDNNYEKAQTTIKVKISRQEISDETIVDAVIAKINEIGEVVYSDACKARIDAARTAYNGLADTQKVLVSNYGTLTAAETRYAEIKMAAEQSSTPEENPQSSSEVQIDPAPASQLAPVPQPPVPAQSASGSEAKPSTETTAHVVQELITISKTPASVKAKAKKNKVTVSWRKIKKKNKALLAQIKGIQVQYSTDPKFEQNPVTKKIGKTKTKVTLNLKSKTAYYVRVRYMGNDGVSNWSRVKKVKAK